MRALLLCLTLTGCWPYISGPFDSDGVDDTSVDGPGGDLIGELRAGDLELGSEVEVRDIEVTAVWSLGFYAQDPRGGTSNAGIHVFLDADPPVEVGDRVTVQGIVGDYFGELQIEGSDVEVLGDGTGIEPLILGAIVAADDRYEGMLIRIDGEVTDLNYDCAIDNENCRDQNLWEVGGGNGLVIWNRCFTGSAWSSLEGQLPVMGVQTMRFERRRLMPRSAEDFGG